MEMEEEEGVERVEVDERVEAKVVEVEVVVEI